ncbi:acetyl-CoA C-acetyltransferase [Citrobacter sp. RHBSTW-00089]|uniref:acetyl-CoA C-acetyltransferase n=1 Tax=Citrobacter sp. RHBSTW-00089 TaxID=2742633 RepID=UPI0015F92592|nr:acetyl-CoA C-acetyltransferase [Citrobacter sp. RHBSTW-00089]MBA8090418.1 acetyl-CoA C-acetyltransferase [Citrobacter sp. RHBSTW-00089]
MKTRTTYVVGGVRIPFMKSMTAYRDVTTPELMTASLKSLVERYNLKGKVVGDVALGALMQSSANWNFAREVVQASGLHPNTPAYNVQRACGTSLETTIQIAHKISSYQIESGIAGGVDSNSDLPIMVTRSFSQKLVALNSARTLGEKLRIFLSFRPSDLKPVPPAVVEPRTGKSMGEHCELMVKEWKISRQEQDELALASHLNAAKAYKDGFYADLVFPFLGKSTDGIMRGDTTLEKLAKLKPAFDRSEKGTLTAGNSSSLTDGSSTVLLASEEEAKKNNWPLLAKIVDSHTSAVDYVAGEGLLMVPTVAVSELLKRNGLKLQDFDFYEIHEAFAGQVLCTMKAWESAEYCKTRLGRSEPLGKIDRSKLNVRGSSIALGHPFAATGAKIVGVLAKILHSAGPGKRGLIVVCTAGGMGVATILES